MPVARSNVRKRAAKPAKTKLGLRAYARHRGVALKTVQQAIVEGRIKKDRSGLIDVGKADRDWKKNTSEHQGGRRTPAPPPKDPIEAKHRVSFAEHRTEKEKHLALLRRQEYERRAGLLVERAQVDRDWLEACRRMRDALLAVPDRIVDQVAAELGVESGPLYDLLVREIRAVLASLAEEFQSHESARPKLA